MPTSPPKPCPRCNALAYKNGRCTNCPHNTNLDRRPPRPPRHPDHHTTAWRKASQAARQAQPWCTLCHATEDLTLDHERGQVECRRCNSSHRRNPA